MRNQSEGHGYELGKIWIRKQFQFDVFGSMIMRRLGTRWEWHSLDEIGSDSSFVGIKDSFLLTLVGTSKGAHNVDTE